MLHCIFNLKIDIIYIIYLINDMVNYSCKKCKEEFKQKQSYIKHINNQSCIDINNSVYEKISLNDEFVNDINQILHNAGIEFSKRLDIILECINYSLYKIEIKTNITQYLKDKIVNIVKSITINKNEVFQILFMFYCNKNSKINLDQFYTPFTISEFMIKLLISNKGIIDPACGTGDLVKCYDGCITLWDICSNVLTICKENYILNKKECNIECLDSLLNYDKDNNKYDYCFINPPFGSSTLITDKNVLSNYKLGIDKKKEEIGMLFIERSINLLNDDGIVFIILPNGYLGNLTKNAIQLRKYILTYKIIAIIELPSNSFSRSGTGVSTSILILQKNKTTKDYNIYIKKIYNIGYFLNKKNTPYKYKCNNGKYLTDNGTPILDNDLNDCYNELLSFNLNENIKNIKTHNTKTDYEVLNTKDIDNYILDINRYLSQYKNIIYNHISNNSTHITDYIEIDTNKFTKLDDKQYVYLDIKQITTPIYNKNNILYGYDLPQRAKIQLQKYDIIISKLKGKITFTIILDDDDNIICTNGFCLLRPKNYDNALIIFSNLFTNDFKIQHNSLCTGSIMETISEKNIKHIYINKNIDTNKYKNVIDALFIINQL